MPFTPSTAFTLGQPVRVAQHGGRVIGIFRGYSHSGFCSVQLPDSSALVTVHIADVERAPLETRRASVLTWEDV